MMDAPSDEIRARREQWIRTSTLEENGPQRVLRIWGHADNLEVMEARDRANKEEPWSFNIRLDSHEYILELNAATVPDRPSVHLTRISQDLAARHTKVHLDRFSQAGSHLPFIQQINPWHIEDGRSIVLVYLFDRRGSHGEPDQQAMSWFGREYISRNILLKAVQKYLRPGLYDSKGDAASTTSLITQKQGGTVTANIIIRGRLRRRNLRHGVKGPNIEPSQAVASSTPLILLRGRIRRRRNRHKLHHHGLDQQRTTNNQQHQPAEGPKAKNPMSLLNTNLVSRLPENLRRLPRIIFFGKSRGDLSDSIVIPLMAPYDNQTVLGSLVFPRPFVMAMQNNYSGTEKPAEEPEWLWALRTGPPGIKATSFVTQGCRDIPGNDKEYWRKFDLGLVTHLRSNHASMKGRYRLNVFDLSLWSSFGHPLITYPDCGAGPIAEEREYFDLFDCWQRISPTKSWEVPEVNKWIKWLDFQRHQAYEGFEKDDKYGIFKVKSYQNPAWKSNAVANKLESQGNLAALALNTATYYYALKEFEDQMMSRKDWTFRPPETDDDIASDLAKELERMKVLTAEQSEKEAESLLQLLYRMEKREMWYGAWEHSHIPLWQLEKILYRIKSLAHSNDPQLVTRVKTYAVFQYGICLLAGFGVLRDIDNGLSWVRQSAMYGSRAAQAVVHGLYRAYNREHKFDKDQTQWLIEETKSFSEYAQHELGIVSGTGVATNTRRRHLYAAKYEIDDPWTGLIVVLDDAEREFFGFFNARILSRLAVYSPQYLTRQLELRDEGSLEALIPLLSEEAPEGKPAQFYRALMRWACCFAEMPTFQVIADKGVGFIWRDELQEFLQLALLRGHAAMSMYFLDLEAMTAADEAMKGLEASMYGGKAPGRDPLFLLHHVPDDEVGQLVQKIVSLGFNINSKAKVIDVETQAVYPVSQCHSFYDKKGWDMHLRDEIQGESITPLRWAIAKNKAGLVRALIDAGAEFPLQPERRLYAQTMPDKWSPDILTVAVLDQPCYNIDILHMFFEKHGDQEGEPVFAESPLGLIVMEPDSPRRRLRIAQHLEGSPDCLFPVLSLIRQYQSENDAELFWAAAMNGHEDIVRYLILQGVEVELRWKGMTPLHTAILHGRNEVVGLLLEHGADPWAVTSETRISSLHLLFWKEKPDRVELAIFDQLYEILRDVSGGHSDFGNTVSPLHLAVLNSRVKAVERLIQLGAETTKVLGREIMTTMIGEQHTARGIEQQSKRISASQGSQMKDQNVPLRPINIAGYTAAGIILLREDMFFPEQASEMLKLLVNAPRMLTSGIQRFYTRPDYKQTILHLLAWSALREKTDILDWILDAGKSLGLDLNIRDSHGDTPLHYAYAAVGPEMDKKVDALLKLGADRTILNTFGLTPSAMRSHALREHFNSTTHPLEFSLTFRGPFSESQMQPQPPHTDNAECQPLWSLEDWAFSGPQIWDCKTRKMVDIPKQKQVSAPGNPDPYVYTEQKVMAQLRTPGWSGNVTAGHFRTVIEADVVLEIPDELHEGTTQALPLR